jgi:hypothetical protein
MSKSIIYGIKQGGRVWYVGRSKTGRSGAKRALDRMGGEYVLLRRCPADELNGWFYYEIAQMVKNDPNGVFGNSKTSIELALRLWATVPKKRHSGNSDNLRKPDPFGFNGVKPSEDWSWGA